MNDTNTKIPSHQNHNSMASTEDFTNALSITKYPHRIGRTTNKFKKSLNKK